MEGQLIQQWKEIEDLEGDDDSEDLFNSKKEQWFVRAFAFLRDLPEGSHCWCVHKEITLPLLEPFFSYFKETSPSSPLRVLWRRLSREMRGCTRCVVQHHKANDFYASEFTDEVVRPLLDVIRTLDEERVARHMKELLHKFESDTMDPKQDSLEVICIMFEVLMFPFLLDDSEISQTVKSFLLHVEETHDLSLAPGQRYPGVYRLLLHADQGVRRIALRLAHSLPRFKDGQDMESIQSIIEKCMHCLEYDTLDSGMQPIGKAGPHRPRAVFSKDGLWIGLTTILGVLETPAFLKGVMEKYPMFVSIVLNHVSEAVGVFWHALRCLKLLLEVLGYKLWLRTTFSPGVMRNTLLSQCFHSHEERMHVNIFDLFQPFLQSLEALQDGEYENQRRRLLYFLLQQVPRSNNFKPLMAKKARQVAFSMIGRGYSMDPPLPPVECVHVWGPPLVATLKDTSLISSLRKSAVELMQFIIVADAAALATVLSHQPSPENYDKDRLVANDDDGDDFAVESADKGIDGVGLAPYWISFLSITRSVEACEQWSCVPLLWVDGLTGMMSMNISLISTKAIMWALGRLSVIDTGDPATQNNMVATSVGVTCSKDISAAFQWVKPKGYDDGANGEGCVNAVRAELHHKELIGLLKTFGQKHLYRSLEDRNEEWIWEARMAEPCMVLLLDANVTIREFAKEVLLRTGKASTLESGLELLCSSEESAAAVIRGLRHAVNVLLRMPLNKCSRGLQQLFFHVWKLLTFRDKEPEKSSHLAQTTHDGGFLSQPNFQALSLDDSSAPVTNLLRDERKGRRLCTEVSCQVWPLSVKAIREGRQHLEGAGQLMTFTRMLQLLPCLFRNLNASQKKQVICDVHGGKHAGEGQGRHGISWFQAFIRWGEVSSPIIQRWWKEAIGLILDDLKISGLVFSAELEDMIVKYWKQGLQLDETRRLQLMTLLQSVAPLVSSNGISDQRVLIPLKDEKNRDNLRERSEHDSFGERSHGSMMNWASRSEIIDLTSDSLGGEKSTSSQVIDLSDDDESVHRTSPFKEVDLTDRADSRSSQYMRTSSSIPDNTDSERRLIFNETEHSGGIALSRAPEGKFGKPEVAQFRRPLVRQGPPSSGSKPSTLDNFLQKFYSEKAKRETSKGGAQVQSSNNAFRIPPPKAGSHKSQKSDRKLSALRSEHREQLELRQSVEPLVRSQVRERVEKETSTRQVLAADAQSDENLCVRVPEPKYDTDQERNAREHQEATLRDIVRENEADPLDAALDNVRKPRLTGLTEGASKPKRKLITLEMPGESGRGVGAPGKSQTGMVIKPRQIPRLDDWYKRILCWDYLLLVGISDENASPGGRNALSGEEQMEKVPLTFRSAEQYMSIFRALVLEEFKSQLQRSHEEMSLSDGTTAGILRLMSLERVDDFQIGRFMAEAGTDGAARACADNELLLLSRQSLQSGSQSCHLLAKVESRDRESKSRATVLLLKLYIQTGDARLMKAKRLLVDRSKWHMTRIMNATPQFRECQALSSLASLPLLPVLLSPSSNHSKSREFLSSMASLGTVPAPLQSKLKADYNDSQLRAIAAAVGGLEKTNDQELTLIQGPPGTGKTKTIMAVLSVLLAVRSSRGHKSGVENESLRFKPNLSGRRPSAVHSGHNDAAALTRAWQDAARAKDLVKDSERHGSDSPGCKRRLLVCAQSNAAVDEIVSRICQYGLLGGDGAFFKPSVVRVGAANSIHPKSLPVYIETLVDQRLGVEAEDGPELGEEKEQTKIEACRSKLEEVIEFIQTIEALRSQSKTSEEVAGQKTGSSESAFTEKALKILAMGDSAVTAKLNLLYGQRRAFTAEVASAVKEGKKAHEESKNRRKTMRRDIIRQADVVVTTLSGCGGDIYTVCMESLAGGKKRNPVQECFFDAVVIDEAAQALEPATLIPFQLLAQTNARCVMVGDPKQLPATVLSQRASRMQYECSMFERLQRAGHPVVMLSTQYRMHPEIRQFPSAHFYGDLITDGDGLMVSRKAIFHRESYLGPYAFFNVTDGRESRRGGFASQSLSNGAEVAAILQLYLTLTTRYPSEVREGRVGVITPYKQQRRLLQDEFIRALGTNAAAEVEFNTVDGFQGREVDILILSTVRASADVSSSSSSKGGDIGFVADVRRMNVALTRARFSMWIVGNAATLRGNPSWASLLSNAERRSLLFSLKKPYGSFFEKGGLPDRSSLSINSANVAEGHRVPQSKRDDLSPSIDRKGRVGSGRVKEVRAGTRESARDCGEGGSRAHTKWHHTGQDGGRMDRQLGERFQDDGSCKRSDVARSENRLEREEASRHGSDENHRGKDRARVGERNMLHESHHEESSSRGRAHEGAFRARHDWRYSRQGASMSADGAQRRSKSPGNVSRTDRSRQQSTKERLPVEGIHSVNNFNVDGKKFNREENRSRQKNLIDARSPDVSEGARMRDCEVVNRGVDVLRESNEGKHTVPPVKLKHEERKRPVDERKPVSHRESAIVKEKGENKSHRNVRDSRQAPETGTVTEARPNRRTSQDELAAARKRKRAEVDDLLPSAFLASSARAPERRAGHFTSPANGLRTEGKGSDLNVEWSNFEKALGEAKSEVPSAAAGVQRPSSRPPGKRAPGMEKPVDRIQPASDLDGILSGLSSVTRAQAKGQKLDNFTSTHAAQGSGGSKSSASKHL